MALNNEIICYQLIAEPRKWKAQHLSGLTGSNFSQPTIPEQMYTSPASSFKNVMFAKSVVEWQYSLLFDGPIKLNIFSSNDLWTHVSSYTWMGIWGKEELWSKVK